MKKILVIALMSVSLFVAQAFALAGAPSEELVEQILPLGAERPDFNEVSPAHLPVPSGSNGIGPGSQLIIDRPDGSFLCTANFIWKSVEVEEVSQGNSLGKARGHEESGGKGKGGQVEEVTTESGVYLGSAGHCFLPGGTTSTHGSDADYNPSQSTVWACYSNCDFGGQLGAFLGSEGIELRGDFVRLGDVAYARQSRVAERAGQDFGIVEIPSDLSEHIRPEMPVWGGPSEVEEVFGGAGVCVYGNAAGLGEVFPTKARSGVGQGLSPDGKYWRAVLPSFQGDSGSGIVTCGSEEDGLHGLGAAGTLTHIGLVSQNAVRVLGTTMGQAVEMTHLDAGLSIEVVLEDATRATPDPPQWPSQEADGTIGAIGEAHNWSAGPFTRASTIDQGDGCSGVEGQEDECDYEYVEVNVPDGGATLRVTISTEFDQDDDFDLYIWGPDGQPFGSSAAGGTPPEEVAKPVTDSGVYTIAVKPWFTFEATYDGVATLEAPPEPAPPPPPTPEEDSCELPGATVATDPGGDQTIDGGSQHDILSVSAAGLFLGAPDTLVFTMQVEDLSSLPPNSIWKVTFTPPEGTEYFVEMRTNELGVPTFNYGFIDGTISRTQGPADDGFFTEDGTIQITIDTSKVGGAGSGDQLTNVNGTTQRLVGVSAVGGLLRGLDSTLSGTFTLTNC